MRLLFYKGTCRQASHMPV